VAWSLARAVVASKVVEKVDVMELEPVLAPMLLLLTIAPVDARVAAMVVVKVARMEAERAAGLAVVKGHAMEAA